MSYFTATFPYIILTILVVKGALLEGAEYGIEFYIGKFEYERMLEPGLWMDAVSFSLIYHIITYFESKFLIYKMVKLIF